MGAARGEHFAVFDADFVPPPDFLRKTVPYLVADSRCGFVQTRWGHHNRDYSLLTQVQAMGIDGHFVVEQSARAWNGLFLLEVMMGIWAELAFLQYQSAYKLLIGPILLLHALGFLVVGGLSVLHHRRAGTLGT